MTSRQKRNRRKRLLVEQQGTCALCAAPLQEDMEIDHIRPVIRGGKHSYSNLRLVHSSCHDVHHWLVPDVVRIPHPILVLRALMVLAYFSRSYEWIDEVSRPDGTLRAA